MQKQVSYVGKNVLITGGLGFIGSNLAIRLAHEGAAVVVVDPCLAGCGGNPYNLAPVADQVRLLPCDISDPTPCAGDIARADVIFNLAGEISHIHSMEFPERDLEINTLSQLRFLEACRRLNRGVRIVYAGTRQIYGPPEYLPVDERHPVNPVDFNGVHKYAATMYHLMLSSLGDLDAVVLRLTNVYGPRMSLRIPCQGFLSVFLRRLIRGEELEIYGDGSQLRDPLYVDDAVDAFLLAGQARLPERTYNIGGPDALELREIARLSRETAGGPKVAFVPFPEERKAIDIGSYHTDSRRLGRDFDWTAQVRFHDGIARTLEYYRAELGHYLNPGDAPTCNLPEHAGIQRRLTFTSHS